MFLQLKSKTKSNIFVLICLLSIDVISVYSSYFFAAQIRKMLIFWIGGSVYWPVYQPFVLLTVFTTLFLFYLNDLYPGYGLTAVKEMERLFKLLTLIFGFLGGIVFFFKIYLDFPRSILLFAWLISLVLVPLLRFLFRNRASLYDWYGVPVILITNNPQDPALKAVYNCRRMGWNPKIIFNYKDSSKEPDASECVQVSSWEDLLLKKDRFAVDIAVLSSSYNSNNPLEIRKLTDIFKRIILIFPYYNLGSLWVKPRDLEGNLALEIEYHLLDSTARFVKRGIDIIGSLIFLALFSPFLIILSLAIYIDSPGPIFYRQKRIGKDQTLFNALKFRSMVLNAETKLDKILDRDPKARREYEKYHKLKNDPRITNVGKFLRKFSLDELPQLLNVLKGEMSLCGPRAYMPSELDDIGDYADVILRVKPGMTGWWQVMGRHNTTFQYRLRMDEYYISNWSLWLDLYILYKTVWVVISGTGT